MRPRTADVSPEDTPHILQLEQKQKKTDKTLPDPLRQGIARAQSSSALLAKMATRVPGEGKDLGPQVPFRLPTILGQKEPKI